MSSIDPELAARLGEPVTTCCSAWRVTLRDGRILGFTDHDRTLDIDGTSFEPGGGMNATDARDSAGFAVDSTEVSGILNTGRFTDEDIEAGLLDSTTVETLLVDWRAPPLHQVVRKATVGRIRRAGAAFVAELESAAAFHAQPGGRLFRRSCDAKLGDARCGIDLGLADYRAVVSIIEKRAERAFAVDGLGAFADGDFNGATLRIDAATVFVPVHRNVGSEHWLDFAARPDLSPGQTGELVAGCDQTFARCRDRFANTVNFRGFPHLPGNDEAYAYATEDGVFDGAPLVP
ncbi:MAG: DUF2163 domain-containing protein [Rhizobiaceae bacterium]